MNEAPDTDDYPMTPRALTSFEIDNNAFNLDEILGAPPALFERFRHLVDFSVHWLVEEDLFAFGSLMKHLRGTLCRLKIFILHCKDGPFSVHLPSTLFLPSDHSSRAQQLQPSLPWIYLKISHCRA